MKAVAAVTTIIRVAMNQLFVSRSVNEESPAVLDFFLTQRPSESYGCKPIEFHASCHFSHCTGMS